MALVRVLLGVPENEIGVVRTYITGSAITACIVITGPLTLIGVVQVADVAKL